MPDLSRPEPITPEPPRAISSPLLTQSWLDLTFLHWPVDVEAAARLLPAGTVPDTVDGVTYVGVIPFRMHRAGLLGFPGMPYLGSFPETNVRLYSVDRDGRRGVVFLSLDASRLAAVTAARVGFGLPYQWSRMDVSREDDTVTYTSARRWPGPRGARSRFKVRIGERLTTPTALEYFLTARWGLHHMVRGRLTYMPNAHRQWPLHRAALLEWDEGLVAAGGLPAPMGEPVSVLYSPGVEARFGAPARV